LFADLLVVSQEVLSRRTNDYRGWVESYARNHKIPTEWAEKTNSQRRLRPAHTTPDGEAECHGVYFIFKSMEQGRAFRISVPKFPTPDPNHRILHANAAVSPITISTFGMKVLEPILQREASFFPFHAPPG